MFTHLTNFGKSVPCNDSLIRVLQMLGQLFAYLCADAVNFNTLEHLFGNFEEMLGYSFDRVLVSRVHFERRVDNFDHS